MVFSFRMDLKSCHQKAKTILKLRKMQPEGDRVYFPHSTPARHLGCCLSSFWIAMNCETSLDKLLGFGMLARTTFCNFQFSRSNNFSHFLVFWVGSMFLPVAFVLIVLFFCGNLYDKRSLCVFLNFRVIDFWIH